MSCPSRDEPAFDAFPRLLGDLGGTHARWAWQVDANAPLERLQVHRTADHANALASARAYLDEHRLGQPATVGLGVATAVDGDEIRMTNLAWRFSQRELGAALGASRCLAINDFTALALSVTCLQRHELQPVGRGHAVPGAARAVVGPGTGLGVSGLVADGRGRWLPLCGEGGHVTLAATTPGESAIVALLQARFGHVSAERVLSGSGLVNLHVALCERDGVPPTPLAPSEVTRRAVDGSCGRCVEAVQLFTAFLGDVAGNLALTLGARGGVYLGGGIVPRLGRHFDVGLFRRRFEQKGRFEAYLQPIAVWLITAEAPALRGVVLALDDSTPSA